MSWRLGQCRSSQVYQDNEVYAEECCQEAGLYDLVCMDAYEDGWKGGYIEIEGTQYCKDFVCENYYTDWYEICDVKVEEVTMGNVILHTYMICLQHYPHIDFDEFMKS